MHYRNKLLDQTSRVVDLNEVSRLELRSCMRGYAKAFILGMGVLKVTHMAYRSLKPAIDSMGEQGGKEDFTSPEPLAQELDSTLQWNPSRYPTSKLALSHASKTTSQEQLASLVEKRMLTALVCTGDESVKVQISPLGGGKWITVGHAFKEGKTHQLKVAYGERTDYQSGPLTALLAPSDYVLSEERDLAVFSAPGIPGCVDLHKFYPEDFRVRGPFSAILVGNDPSPSWGLKQVIEKTSENIIGKPALVCVDGTEVFAVTYKLSRPTEKGWCGRIAVSGGAIVLMHSFGGREEAEMSLRLRGGGLPLSRTYVLSMMDKLDGKVSTLCPANESGNFPPDGVSLNPHLHDKDPANFIHQSIPEDVQTSAVTYGSHNNPRKHFKSSTNLSEMKAVVEEVMDLPCEVGPIKYMNNRSVYKWVTSAGTLQDLVDGDRLVGPVKDMTDLITEGVKSSGLSLQPYNVKVGVNGAPYVAYIKGLNLKTSAGFPQNCPKTELLVSEVDEFGETYYMPNEELSKEMECNRDLLGAGEQCYPIFSVNLKDEIRPLTKEHARVFTGVALWFSILVRQYFLPLIRVMMNNPVWFELAVGVNSASSSWDVIYKAIVAFGATRLFAGDYSKYDVKMQMKFMLGYAKCLYDSMVSCYDYDEYSKNVLRGLLTGMAMPLYEVNGSFFRYMGSHASGHNMTVFFNCGMNGLILRYVYYIKYAYSLGDFKKHVALMTYGDDNAGSVHVNKPLFNQLAISEECAKIGITYTTPDKTAVLEPYLDPADLTFLKRSFVVDERGICRSPIELASIAKMLHGRKKSKVLTPLEADIEAVLNVNREFYQYGREEHEKRRLQLYDVIESTHLREAGLKLKSYDEFDADMAKAYSCLNHVPVQGDVGASA